MTIAANAGNLKRARMGSSSEATSREVAVDKRNSGPAAAAVE